MKCTIDSAGRLVIPAEIRREARIAAGQSLEIRWRDGIIEIEPAATPVRLARRGRLLVAEPEAGWPSLTEETVESTRRDLRRSRG